MDRDVDEGADVYFQGDKKGVSSGPRPRIFVSSLMTGYGGIREVTAQAIGEAGCEPVLAERFPGGTVSPGTCPHNPLWIYDRPRKAVRRDLREPGEEIKRTLNMTKLHFKDWEGNRW